ncbi:MAG: hypothetical protein KAU35_08450 [candidate division Zixibacteria bacterium]|nr:hypothetical protein [candidate division Zixibacteria bacterium]
MNSAFAIVLAVFFGSGVLGYIFSTVYWSLYWCIPSVIINYGKPLKALACGDSRMLGVCGESGQLINDDVIRRFDKRTAWAIVNQYYNSSMRSDGKRSHIVTYLDGLLDILHGLGATIVGTALSGGTWALIHHSHLGCNRTFFEIGDGHLVLVGYTALAFFLVTNYGFTRRNIRVILNSAFATDILDEYNNRGSAVKICQTEYSVKEKDPADVTGSLSVHSH